MKAKTTCKMLQCQSEADNVSLKLHAVTIREALIEKSKECDQLSEENQIMTLKIMKLEKKSHKYRYASNMIMSNLQEKFNLYSSHKKKILHQILK